MVCFMMLSVARIVYYQMMELLMNELENIWKEWPVLGQYPITYLEGLRKAAKI